MDGTEHITEGIASIDFRPFAIEYLNDRLCEIQATRGNGEESVGIHALRKRPVKKKKTTLLEE